jgi:hypothetical protein
MEVKMLSQKLIHAVKLSERKAYRIAHEAGLHPSTLSSLLNGIEKAKRNDKRVIAVGRVLGISADECFQETIEEVN